MGSKYADKVSRPCVGHGCGRACGWVAGRCIMQGKLVGGADAARRRMRQAQHAASSRHVAALRLPLPSLAPAAHTSATLQHASPPPTSRPSAPQRTACTPHIQPHSCTPRPSLFPSAAASGRRHGGEGGRQRRLQRQALRGGNQALHKVHTAGPGVSGHGEPACCSPPCLRICHGVCSCCAFCQQIGMNMHHAAP